MKNTYFLSIILLLFLQGLSKAQDTLSISIKTADSLFINNSLLLLAEKYNIEEKQFLVMQEKLWPNPFARAEVSLYNHDTKQWMDVGDAGQKIFSIEQMISIAGKRNKRIQIANMNTRISEQEFYDLMRTLKFELRNSFYSLYFSSKTIAILSSQLSSLKETINAMEIQYRKGNIPFKELIRLEALWFELGNTLLEQKKGANEELKNLRILLNTDAILLPVTEEESLNKYQLNALNVEDLTKRALLNRSDLKLHELLVERSKWEHALQKSMAVPDLYLGGVYDQAGSYIQNYVGVSLAMDLPVFNRNQGHIKASRAEFEKQKLLYSNKELEVSNEVFFGLERVKEAESLYRSIDTKVSEDFDLINKGMLENFKRRNINLIEFIDFFETYNGVIIELNQLNAKRIGAYEELNYYTGNELF